MKKSLISIAVLTSIFFTSCGEYETVLPEKKQADSETVSTVQGTDIMSTSASSVSFETTAETVISTESETSAESETSTEAEISTEAYADDDNSAKTNKYGFYPCPTPVYTSISVASLDGVWYDTSSFSNFLIITEGTDIYNGRWEYQYEGGGSQSGYILLENMTDHDIESTWFTFYEDDGTLWHAFAATGEIPLDDIYAEQTGEPHFTRQQDENGSMVMNDGTDE